MGRASVGAPIGRVLTLSYDNPNAVAPERLRSDVCVELRTEAVPPPGIETGPVGGGRYGVYRLKGSHEGIDEAYRWLFGAWLPESGETVDGRPCMELYRNTPHDTASPEHLATDLCVPLRGKRARLIERRRQVPREHRASKSVCGGLKGNCSLERRTHRGAVSGEDTGRSDVTAIRIKRSIDLVFGGCVRRASERDAGTSR